jgi:hypothetical protein
MNVFCLDELGHVFIGALPPSLAKLVNLADGALLPAGIEQFFSIENHHGVQIRWIGLRTSIAGRLLGAVVKKKDGERHFFILDYTASHDYQKTLVGNGDRLSSFRSLILRHVAAMEAGLGVVDGGASGHGNFKEIKLIYHKCQYIRLDLTQLELTNMSLDAGLVCFSPPGVGKTLVAVERAKAYLSAELRVAFVLPTKRLADEVRREFAESGVTYSDADLMVFSLDEYLSYMSSLHPELGTAYVAKADSREFVDKDFFSLWIKSNSRKPGLPKFANSVYWEEFCNVFMRPDWRDSEQAHLGEEVYVGLGLNQSNIPVDERRQVYHLFIRFFRTINDESRYYFPLHRAHKLYKLLGRDETLKRFDAVVVDEIQRFKPWEWASVMAQLENGPRSGRFLLFGDAYQGGFGTQSLWLSQVLRSYFISQGVSDLPIRRLLINHRNAQKVSRFVHVIHQMEDFILGAMERDTYAEASESRNAELGELQWMPGVEEREQIKADAGAYVVIPDESCRAAAELLWSKRQIVTLVEFIGLSARTVVMHGFSAYYKRDLDAIHVEAKELPRERFSSLSVFSRLSKGREAPLLRACLQALYTAASRAEMKLVLNEPQGKKIHPFFEQLFALADAPALAMGGAGGPGGASASAASSLVAGEDSSAEVVSSGLERAAAAVVCPASKSTTNDWLLRANQDFNNGLIENAKTICADRATWADDGMHRQVLALLSATPVFSEEVLQAINVLFASRGEAPSKAVDAPAASAALLTERQSNYISGLLSALTPKNLEGLFGVKDEQLKEFLFYKNSNNKGSFLFSLVLGNKLKDFCQKISPIKFKRINKIYALIESPDIALRLCWSALQDEMSNTLPKKKAAAPDKPFSVVDALMVQISSDSALLAQFFESPDACSMLEKYWETFKKHFNLEKLASDLGGGVTPFFLLTTSNSGQALIQKYWSDFADHLSAKVLFQVRTRLGTKQGTSAFYWLAATPEGCAILSKHWSDFARHLNAEGLFQVRTGMAPEQGTSAFYWLAATPEGCAILSKHWSDFARHLNAEGLFQVRTGMGPEQGTSAFYWLAGNSEGRAILCAHWSDFARHLGAEGLFQVRTGMGPDQGTSAFYWLTASPEGCAILRAHWSDFARHLSAEGLFQARTGEGPYQGVSAFYCLTATPEGLAILSAHWSDFACHLSAEGLFQVLTVEGAYQGVSAFYWLAASPEGLAILSAHWSDFARHLSAEGLFQARTVEGAHQGISAFYWLTASSAGRTILSEHWSDFACHLSTKGLFQARTGLGPDQGTSAFYWLTASPDGRAILSAHWSDFACHLSPEGLFQARTVAGAHQGTSAFYCLTATSVGRAILSAHWSDFSRHLSAEGLFQACTGEGLNQGTSAFYCLTASPEGRAILSVYWSDFAVHLSAEGLFQARTGMGPDQGTSAFYWLTASSAGRTILSEHWSDFACHLSTKGLFQARTGLGPDQGTSAFYWLTASPDGRAILSAHWSDFAGYISREGLLHICTGEGAHQGMSPINWLKSDAKCCADILGACELILNASTVSVSSGRLGLFPTAVNGSNSTTGNGFSFCAPRR